MKLGLSLSDNGANLVDSLPAVLAAERNGYDSVWLGEAYGSDVVGPLGFLAAATTSIGLGSAVLQMHGRSPALTAMTAMTLDHLSGGRFRLGLGVSGPQVVEGWHGVAFGRPLGFTREYVDVVRSVVARAGPVAHHGDHIRLPYDGPGATGLGRSLKSTVRPLRTEIPVYLAAIGPRNVELAGEIADGWLPLFYAPAKEDVLCGPLDTALAGSGRPSCAVDIVAAPPIEVGPDLDTCRRTIKPTLALYIGGMGARGRNFYFDLACRYGYEEAANEIQDAYLAGHKSAAAAAVPDTLVDEVALVGPLERIAEQLGEWKKSRVSTLCLRTTDTDVIDMAASLI
jgi:F420-dependent oxidoreductase-like protein